MSIETIIFNFASRESLSYRSDLNNLTYRTLKVFANVSGNMIKNEPGILVYHLDNIHYQAVEAIIDNTATIAYDLDGVLVPDYHYIPGITQDEFYAHLCYAQPLFEPQGVYDIVTARLARYRPQTEQWINQLKNPPRHIIMADEQDEVMDPWRFKADICNEYDYMVYLESSPRITALMRPLTKTKVIHITEYMNMIMSTLTK